MVSKGNSNRKKDSVKESKPKEKAEPKPEVNQMKDHLNNSKLANSTKYLPMEEVIKQVAQKVVSELKPDMVNKINENTQQLAKQIAEEIKDIRASIQQPQQTKCICRTTTANRNRTTIRPTRNATTTTNNIRINLTDITSII